jgi:hypothetical protein
VTGTLSPTAKQQYFTTVMFQDGWLGRCTDGWRWNMCVCVCVDRQMDHTYIHGLPTFTKENCSAQDGFKELHP